MKIKELNTKINIVIGMGIMIVTLICVYAGLRDNGLQEQIDRNECIMGESCPEINSILADKISEVLDRDGLKLKCIEYEQIQIIAYNTTCKSCGYWINTPKHECRFFSEISEEDIGCDYGRELISKDAIITTKDGDCLRYEIIKA